MLDALRPDLWSKHAQGLLLIITLNALPKLNAVVALKPMSPEGG